MKRKVLIKRMMLLFALTLLLPSLSYADSNHDVDTPTFKEGSVHDPSVIQVNDTYYVFGSHLAAAKTTDFMNWEKISDGVDADNKLFEDVTKELEEAFEWATKESLWAPDVAQLDDGRYYMYYNAAEGSSPRSALGVAVSDNIEGPYEDEGIFLKSGMWDEESENAGEIYDANIHPNAIDPHTFYDADGKLWMVYGSYSGGIFILEMDAETGFPIDGQGYGTKLMGGNHSRIEAPYIQYVPETGYYYLYTTFGGLAADGGYNMRVARSENPDGPYVDAEGNDMINVKGEEGSFFDDDSIEPYGVKLMGNYLFERHIGEPGEGTGLGYVSPGHNSVYYDEETGEQLLIFHSRFPERGEAHEIRVHQMFMNEEGWPVVAPYRYAEETLENVDKSEVTGDYKFINHGKEITDDIKESVMITLEDDGILSGVEGTWAINGDHNVVIEIDGSTYEGVFIEQWDPVSERNVMTFTAVSEQGISIWGSQVAHQSDADIVESVINDLSLGNTNEILNDLELPTEGAQGTEINWASSHPDVVSEQGVVSNPAIGEEPMTVKLTATVSKGDEIDTKEFKVTVMPARDEGLVAHYPFDGDLSDVSGNFDKDDVEVVGPVIPEDGGKITFTEGKRGEAAVFDGQSGIKLPDGLIKSHAYTVSVWLKPEKLTQHTTTFFGSKDENHWVSLVPMGEDGETLVWSGSASWYDETTGITMENGEWHHLAFTVDDGDLDVYLNGELEFSDSNFPDIFTTSDGEFALGVNYWDEPYEGLMDDLLIYEGALTEDEIVAYFEDGVIPGAESDTDPETDPEPDIDTSDIEDLLEEAESISNEDQQYTDDSFSNLQDVIKEAKTVLDDPQSEDELNRILEELEKAIKDLDEVPEAEEKENEETEIDTDALEQLIAEAKDQVEQTETYTEASIQQLEAAILEAELALENIQTEDDLDQAIQQLEDVLGGLEPEEGNDSEDHSEKESDSGDAVGNGDEDGKELPKTATPMFQMLLIGFVLLSLGGLFLLRKRKVTK